MKTTKILLLLIAVLILGAVLVSCDDHTHEFIDTVTAPTCTEGGYTVHSCECGYSFKDTNTDPLGHDLANEKVVTEPTCMGKGKTLKTCTRCSHSETGDISALGHTYTGVWEVTKEPSCGQKGVESMFCQICNAAITRDIDAKEHDFGEWIKKSDASCLVGGLYTPVKYLTSLLNTSVICLKKFAVSHCILYTPYFV